MLTLYANYIFYISYVFLYFFVVVMENPNLEKDSILTNKSHDSDVCEKSLFDVLSEKWDTERLKETDTVDNLVASFAVDYGSEKMLRAWIHSAGCDDSDEISISSFARELDDLKWALVENWAGTEWVDKIMDRVRNYVLYGASNRTEPEEK